MNRVLKFFAIAATTVISLWLLTGAYFAIATIAFAPHEAVKAACSAQTPAAFYKQLAADPALTTMTTSESGSKAAKEIQVQKFEGKWMCVCRVNIAGDRIDQTQKTFCVD